MDYAHQSVYQRRHVLLHSLRYLGRTIGMMERKVIADAYLPALFIIAVAFGYSGTLRRITLARKFCRYTVSVLPVP